MKLTAQDLQIGDWVMYHNDKDDDDPIYVTIDAEDFSYEGRIEDAKPILITPKILKKNDFRVVFEDELHVCYFQDIGRFHVEIKVDKVGIFQKLSMCDGLGNKVTIIECKFVHQLQQAMRLCKIRKEIKL